MFTKINEYHFQMPSIMLEQLSRPVTGIKMLREFGNQTTECHEVLKERKNTKQCAFMFRNNIKDKRKDM